MTKPLQRYQGLAWLLLTTLTTSSLNSFAQDAADADVAEAKKKVAAEIDSIGSLLSKATSSRVTVAMTTRSRVADEVLSEESAIYQIAARAPNQFTAYLKAPEQSLRVFSNADQCYVLVSPTAYYEAQASPSFSAAVMNLPAPLGPYPEPIMALALCGIDPAQTLLGDMRSLAIVDHEPLDKTPAVHLQGTQVDGVSWDLWIGTEKEKVQPLKMIIDLTTVVGGEANAELPENFVYEIELDFTLWRLNVELDDRLFVFTPPQDAVAYESLENFYQSSAEADVRRELVGRPAPNVVGEIIDPAKIDADGNVETQMLDASELRGKIVILDFWTSWCGQCIEATPVIAKVADQFRNRGVVFYAVNIGQTEAEVTGFLQTASAKPIVLMDPEGKVADAFKVDAIPQTVIIGKDGRVAMVHVGFASLGLLEKELAEQLEILAAGGTLREPVTD